MAHISGHTDAWYRSAPRLQVVAADRTIGKTFARDTRHSALRVLTSPCIYDSLSATALATLPEELSRVPGTRFGVGCEPDEFSRRLLFKNGSADAKGLHRYGSIRAGRHR